MLRDRVDRAVICLLLAPLAVLLTVAPAAASQTFGADLGQSLNSVARCQVTDPAVGSPCAFLSKTFSSGSADAGSPIDGVLVSVRLRHSGPTVAAKARVFRSTGFTNQFTNVAEIAMPLPANSDSNGTITEVAARQSVRIGDRLGIAYALPSTPLLHMARGTPRVALSREGTGTDHPVDSAATYSQKSGVEILIAATVEPDGDGDGYGDETQDSCPTDATAQGSCPSTAVGGSSNSSPNSSPTTSPSTDSSASPATSSGSSSSGTADAVLPEISGLLIEHRRFAVNRGSRPSRRLAKGSTIRYALSEPATVQFVIERVLRGRKADGKCRTAKHKNRSKRACTVYRRLTSFSEQGKKGKNRHRFSGVIDRKALAPGRYRFVVSATDAAGNTSDTWLLKFTIA